MMLQRGLQWKFFILQVTSCDKGFSHDSGDRKDSKYSFKTDLIPFVFSFLTNATITELNISHHQVGDQLAVALAKVLQVQILVFS